MSQLVLIVDDDERLRSLIVISLQRNGFETLEADNGVDAINLARVHQPALVLCDVAMEPVGGFEVLRALRSEPATALLPFILITGSTGQQGMRAGMSLGADDYLNKPFSMEEMLAAIRTRLKRFEAMRSQAERELAELRDQVSSRLPHELLTPLCGVLGCAELLSHEAHRMPREEIAAFAREITSSGRRLQRVVNRFLSYARMELVARDAHQSEALLKGRTFNTRAVIETAGLARADAHGRRADLVLELATGAAAISEDCLAIMTEELADNAFKFSPAGSKVRIHSAVEEGRFAVTFEDHGCGMPAAQTASEGESRMPDQRLGDQPHSDLGLAITRRLVHLHHGSLQINAKPNVGTTVQVILPVPATSVETSEPMNSRPGISKLTKHVFPDVGL